MTIYAVAPERNFKLPVLLADKGGPGDITITNPNFLDCFNTSSLWFSNTSVGYLIVFVVPEYAGIASVMVSRT